MRSISLCMAVSVAALLGQARAQTSTAGISLNGELALAGQIEFPVQGTNFAQRQVPCGGFGTPPCPPGGAVTDTSGPTAEQLFEAAKLASVRHQDAQAITYLTRSAEMGYRKAQYALGTDYLNGNGVPQDKQKAEYWLELAAKQGSTSSQQTLSKIEPEKAIHYLQLGASQRDPQSEFDLGMDYELGQGVPHDRAKAMQYLRNASRDGGHATGEQIAAILAKAPATKRFQSSEQLLGMVPPAPFNAVTYRPPGCPELPDSSFQGTIGGLDSVARTFCMAHPNCILSVGALGPQKCFGDQSPVHLTPY